jgi:hypothetical protein
MMYVERLRAGLRGKVVPAACDCSAWGPRSESIEGCIALPLPLTTMSLLSLLGRETRLRLCLLVTAYMGDRAAGLPLRSYSCESKNLCKVDVYTAALDRANM